MEQAFSQEQIKEDIFSSLKREDRLGSYDSRETNFEEDILENKFEQISCFLKCKFLQQGEEAFDIVPKNQGSVQNSPASGFSSPGIFPKGDPLKLQFKMNSEKNTMMIFLIFTKNTKLNPFIRNASFLIEYVLDYCCSLKSDGFILKENSNQSWYDSAKKDPQVTSLSDCTFPSIMDNRNLLYSIISKKFDHSSITSVCSDLCLIISNIPKFLKRIFDNFLNKTLVFYGDYYLDNIYDMNKFLINPKLNFYKMYQRIIKVDEETGVKTEKLKERYVILTELYFLLFNPVPNRKNMAKLIFWGDIRQIKRSVNFKILKNTLPLPENLYLEWRNYDNISITFDLFFIKSNMKHFLENCQKKIKKLKERFEIFQEDLCKPRNFILNPNGSEDCLISQINSSFSTTHPTALTYSFLNVDSLARVIKFKEHLLKKCGNEKNFTISKELLFLYQKIIEVLSSKDESTYEIYLKKLQTLLNEYKGLDLMQECPSNINVECLNEFKPFQFSNNNHIDYDSDSISDVYDS
jgi:hypothetical protein